MDLSYSLESHSAKPKRHAVPIGLLQTYKSHSFIHPNFPADLLDGLLDKSPVLDALESITSGVPEEEASRSLTWKDFEKFCAQLLRAAGYVVRENVVLSRPRAQIDLIAAGPRYVINIDCKHWRRAPSTSSLDKFAQAQLRRSRLLRRNLDDPRPIVSAILSISEPAGGFIAGVAVVPLRTLRDFLANVESFSDMFETC